MTAEVLHAGTETSPNGLQTIQSDGGGDGQLRVKPPAELGVAIIDAAVSASSVLVTATDAEGRYIYVSDEAARLMGVDRAMSIGKRVRDVAFAPIRDGALLAHAPVSGCVVWSDRSESPPRRLEVTCRPVYSPDNDATAFVCTAVDIEEQVAQAYRAAGDSQDISHLLERLRIHVENTPLGVIEWSHDLRIVYWSKRAETILGWTASEAAGRSADDLGLIHPEDREDVDCALSELLAGACSSSRLNCRVISKEVGILHCAWYNSVLVSLDGEIRLLSFVLDNSDKHSAEAAHRNVKASHRHLIRDVLASVTEGRLLLCDAADDLPDRGVAITDIIDLSLPDSVHALRHATLAAAAQAGIEAEHAYDFEVAVGEAAANAVRHANSGMAQVHRLGEDTVQVWINDRGPGICFETLPRATLERGFTTAGSLGHGFWMMLKMADRVWLFTGSEGTTIVLEQTARPAEMPWLSTGL